MSEFSPSKDNRDGVRAECKVCSKSRASAWNAANAERRRENDRLLRLKQKQQREAQRAEEDGRYRSFVKTQTIELPDGPGVTIPHGSQKYPDAVILVSPEDVDMVLDHTWCPVTMGSKRTLYAASTFYDSEGVKRTLALHRFILGLTDPQEWGDHINHNGLDCRRSNLRVVSPQQNAHNSRPYLHSTSQYKGVAWTPMVQKWRAMIRSGTESRLLGYFEDEVEAALAFDRAARESHGEYAYLNFPDNQPM